MPKRFDDREVLVEARGLSVARGRREILSNVDMRVRAREIVTVIGPNGAGKTMLIRALLGLIRPDRGTVTRKKGLVVGYLPQRLHVDSTLPLTVGRFLALGVDAGGWDGNEQAARILGEVGAGLVLDTPFNDVSGGERQRVLLARALLRNPDLLVLDEPSQGIDVTGQAELYRLITRIRDARGCGVLMVSHDLHLVMAETDEVVCINQHVCCAGHPEAVAADPAYIQLFGRQVAGALAVYHHEHDHTHHGDGTVVPLPHSDGTGKPGEPADHG